MPHERDSDNHEAESLSAPVPASARHLFTTLHFLVEIHFYKAGGSAPRHGWSGGWDSALSLPQSGFTLPTGNGGPASGHCRPRPPETTCPARSPGWNAASTMGQEILGSSEM